ncbi:MAG: PTS transporter subunit EIIB [Acholeplasmataceae bacterium]|nr:PTS transporter subunit EIIB [Acholeplasmataceae bacterium]
MDFLIKEWPFILIGVLIILIFIVLYIILRKPKKELKVDVSWVLDLIGKDNITKVEQTQSRVRITVKDLNIVDLESLKKQTKGIFVKENTLVITFLNNTEEIVKGLKKTL